MIKSKRFEPIHEIASTSANDLSRIMADAARKEFDKRRAQWSEKRIEAESLNRVVDRFRKEEQSAADRREQREGDDAAMRLMLARSDRGNA